jgi:hypothetical protein
MRRQGAAAYNHIIQAMPYVSELWEISAQRDQYVADQIAKKERGEPYAEIEPTPAYTPALNAVLQALDLAEQGMLAIAQEWWGMDRDGMLKHVG